MAFVWNFGCIELIQLILLQKILNTLSLVLIHWQAVFEKGSFKLDALPSVEKNVHLIKGFFSDSIRLFLGNNNENCAFIHIDCDLYSSTKTIFNRLNS